MMEIREGYMPFMGYQTYYRMVGTQTGNKKPLILLHGGPGSTHNYFEVLDRLAEEDGRQLVMYDQIGCGESYVEDRPDLWNAEVWIRELEELRSHLGLSQAHLLGQSWVGCFCWSIYAIMSRKELKASFFPVRCRHPGCGARSR